MEASIANLFSHPVAAPLAFSKPPKSSIVETARQFALLIFDAAEKADISCAIDAKTLRLAQRAGLLMAPFPRSAGGEDLLAPDRRDDLVAVLRLVGWGDLVVGRLIEGHINAIELLCRHGTQAQIDRAAGDVADGALMGVWGANDAIGLTAARGPQRWRLQGRKILASGAGFLSRPVVTADSAAGQIMVLPRLPPGEQHDVSGWTAQGMRATATGTVNFSGMVLEDDQILGDAGDFTRQPHFSGGAWRFCAVQLGGMERLVDCLRTHLLERGRDTDPYQLQRVALCVAATTTASFWIIEAGRLLAGAGGDSDTIVAFVNLTRMVTERSALDVLEAVHRGVGLQGFIHPHPIERVSRDLSTYLRQPVPDLAMSDAARTVLASSRETGRLWTE